MDFNFVWIAVWILDGASALLNPQLTVPATADAREPFLIQCNYSPKNLGTPQTINQNPTEPNGEISELSKDPTELLHEGIEGESPMVIDRLRRKREMEKNEAIQSLKLYAGAAEVFRYSPSPTPQYHRFSSTQAHVAVERWRCADGGCEVTVRARPGRLTWRCDLSGEGPTFDITSSLATVDVFSEPVYPPTIVGDPGGVVSAGTVLLLNCSTDLAAPPAYVTWMVDGQQLAEDSMSDVGIGLLDEIGLCKSWRGARIVVPPGEAAVSVECVATQPPPAATTRRSVVVLQKSLQPQISKYTAASGSPAISVAVLSMWVLVMVLLLETT